MENNNNTLDENLAKLRDIGIKEISKVTKLATSKIEDVLEKRFDKIDKVRAKGFIHILEREYDVDLRDWLKAQAEANNDVVGNVSQFIELKEREEQEQEAKQKGIKKGQKGVLNIGLKNRPITKSESESYTWLYVSLVIILLALMGYFAYKAFIQDYKIDTKKIEQNRTESKETQGYDGVFFDPTQALEGSDIVPNDSDLTQKPQNQPESPSTDVPNTESSQVPSTRRGDNADSSNTQSTTNEHPEQNFFFNPTAQARVQNQQTQNPAIEPNILYVQSQGDLWLGVISLQNGTKEQFAYKNSYEVRLSGEMLLVMGHSNFKLMLNGEEIPHGSKHPVRMYYDGKQLKDIGYSRFKELNGGAEW